jgi:ArsR family transcriptional regulator
MAEKGSSSTQKAERFKDARGRPVSQLDPVMLHLLNQHSIIPAKTLRSMADQIMPGARRQRLFQVLSAALGFLVVVGPGWLRRFSLDFDLTGAGSRAIISMVTQMNKQQNGQLTCGPGCGDITGLLDHKLFKALCDPSRLAIFCRLAECRCETTVSQAAGCCPTDISVVSRHLAMLRDAGVLHADKRGKEVYYSVRCSEMAATLRRIADAIEACCPPSDANKQSCCPPSDAAKKGDT